MEYVVYLIECQKRGYFYIGVTNGLFRRIRKHIVGIGGGKAPTRGIDKLI